MKSLGFGVIGAGFMGKAYAIALSSVSATFSLGAQPRREMIATSSPESAARAAAALGFARSTANWRELVADPRVDIVAICTPTYLHQSMALEAIAHGKHVLCEKPLGMDAEQADAMALASARAGVQTLVGFNYMKNPATQLARQIIAAGEIGELIHFRGTHNEDFLMNPGLPVDWRLRAASASSSGALLDLGSHIVNLAHFLCGPIAEVVGDSRVVHTHRPGPSGAEPVENDDQAMFLVHFAQGASGSFEVSRVAAGRKMGLTYEVTGTRGAIAFDQERMGELRVHSSSDAPARSGFRTILIGPQHPDYGAFCIGTGHGFGYNDMVVVEMRDMIQAVVTNTPAWPGFAEAAHTAHVLQAVRVSQDSRTWARVPPPLPIAASPWP